MQNSQGFVITHILIKINLTSHIGIYLFQNIVLPSTTKFSRNLLSVGETISLAVGLGGVGVTCSPRDPRFAGSKPTEVDGFFQDVKILSTSPPGGSLSWGSRV